MTTSRSRQLGDGEKPKAIEPTEVFSPGSEHHIDAAEVERIQSQEEYLRKMRWAQEEACRRAGVDFGGSYQVWTNTPHWHNRQDRPAETVEVRLPVQRKDFGKPVDSNEDPLPEFSIRQVYMDIEEAKRKLGIK